MFDPLKRPSNCLFVQATSPVCRFVVVQASHERPKLILAGSFEHDGSDSLLPAIKNRADEAGIRVSRAVLLLPRGELDVNSLRLPPANEDEIPELVGNLLAQQVDDATACVHDFVVCHTDNDDSSDVLTFTLGEETIEKWKNRFKAKSIKLEAITFGGIGAVALLNQVANHPAKTSVVVTATDQDTDLAVVENGKPKLFRTIPCATGNDSSVIDQLAGDIQRTLTLLGHPENEEPRIYLIGTNDDEQKADAKALHDKLGLPVNLVNPLDQLSGDVKAVAKVARPSRFANVIGTACAWNCQTLPVNLLEPKRPAPPPSLWSRFGFWGVVAASLLALGGYMLWEQAAEKQLVVEDLETKLQRLIKPVKKAQTKQSIVGAVESWRANEICWLDELQYLSEKMPPASEATIGGLRMAVPAGQRGSMEMEVESTVSNVRSLEKALSDPRHGVSCKRIVDASNRASSVWRYKTTISVAPSPKLVAASSQEKAKAEEAE